MICTKSVAVNPKIRSLQRRAATLLTDDLVELVRFEALDARGVGRQRELLLFADLIQRLPDQRNLFVLGGGAPMSLLF